jgi:site-specific recombinase XerC
MQLREAYDLFLMEKRVENVSPRTLDFYAWSVGRFVDWSPGASVEEVQALFWDFLDERRSEIGATSLHTAFRGLRTFCLWLHTEGFVPVRMKLPKIRKPETVRRGPSLDEVRQAVRHFDAKTFLGSRNSDIVRVFSTRASGFPSFIISMLTIYG